MFSPLHHVYVLGLTQRPGGHCYPALLSFSLRIFYLCKCHQACVGRLSQGLSFMILHVLVETCETGLKVIFFRQDMAPPEAVYNPTTEQQEPKRPRWFSVPNAHLTYIRFCIKLTEVLFSFIAFILEELVDNCISCTPLYFFEFVSCTAFLFTSLLLVLLATPLHLRVGIGCWPKLDFCYTAIIGVLFLVAACILVGDNQNTSLELAASTMGFLSTAVFVVDVAVFWKTRGLPFGTRTPAESSGNTPVPEEEKLNTNGNANGPE